ncbi:NADP-dependent malic enzyme [Streptomyces sp. NPDC101733]|uniref:NAD(P)-dependent malic enzyme n=1 Tax=unclassified Streptomyces TaxID=2593676 RepID=UPI0037F53BBD
MITTRAGKPVTDAEIFAAHEGGKLGIEITTAFDDPRSLAAAYTPGVARVSRAIAADPALAAHYTWAGRLVAVVTDGTAVLGLGDLGPRAALPVMEGKAAALKKFAGLDAVPLVLSTTDVDEIVETVVRLRHSFGAVSLEDISAPRCFEVEARLVEALDCPVMHDDQHGTAIVVLAALRGACAVLGQSPQSRRVVVHGAGAAGVACASILLAADVRDVTVVDSRGILVPGRAGMNPVKAALAERTNPRRLHGTAATALRGADVFIGVSGSRVAPRLIETMAPDPVVFALSSPDPEVDPDLVAGYAAVTGTGAADRPNQVINTLASPGVYLGALDAGARRITKSMKIAAADALAELAAPDLAADRVVPYSLDPRVTPAVARAVRAAALKESPESKWNSR